MLCWAKRAQWQLPWCLLTSELGTVLLPDWGWFSWAKYKTEGRKGGRGVPARRRAAVLQRAHRHLAEPWGAFSLCCCCWENHSWVSKCSPRLTCTSHIISGRENISKKKINEKETKKKTKSKQKKKPPQNPKKILPCTVRKLKCKELLTGAGNWCTK